MRAVVRPSSASSEPAAVPPAASRRFTRFPPANPTLPGALSVVLHVALVLGLLHALDSRTSTLAEAAPGGASEPVMITAWVHDRVLQGEAPADTDAEEVARAAARARPQRSDPAPLGPPDFDEPASAVPEPSELAGQTMSEAAPIATAMLDLSPVPTLPLPDDPGLAPAVPAKHSIAIDSAVQALLVQRVATLASSLDKAGRTETSWQQDGQPYRAVLTREDGADEMDLERIRVDISTESRSGRSLQTQLTLKRLAYSHFTKIIDKWDPNVELHDDEIIGRFHSNSAFLVSSDRQAALRISGKATTTSAGVDRGQARTRTLRTDAFEGGFETRATRITLPETAPRPRPRAHDPKAYVRRFEYDTHITFHENGRYTWQATGTNVSALETYPLDRPAYLVGEPGVVLHVKGTVSGTVLVYSAWVIVVDGDLRYATDPRLSPESQDYLALVSNQYVQIARPEVTGPGDLQVDAAIFARKGFVVRNIAVPRVGTLSIYGSLTSGTISATEPRYAFRIEFDVRLSQIRLPSFPMTNRYELDQWDPEWVEVEGDAPTPPG